MSRSESEKYIISKRSIIQEIININNATTLQTQKLKKKNYYNNNKGFNLSEKVPTMKKKNKKRKRNTLKHVV